MWWGWWLVTLPGAGEGAGQVIEVVPGLTGALQRLMWSLAETLGNTPGSTRDWWCGVTWWGVSTHTGGCGVWLYTPYQDTQHHQHTWGGLQDTCLDCEMTPNCWDCEMSMRGWAKISCHERKHHEETGTGGALPSDGDMGAMGPDITNNNNNNNNNNTEVNQVNTKTLSFSLSLIISQPSLLLSWLFHKICCIVLSP